MKKKSKKKLPNPTLEWVDKDKRPKLEPRILLEQPELSYRAKKRVSENDIVDNMLIHGDNLLALKALEQDFAGKVKCIYIDPPYNTGSAFTHYDDGLEHSLWLSLMRDRLEILGDLLAEDGSIWVAIDDTEVAFLRILLDQIFGRQSFVATIVWQKMYARDNRAAISVSQEYIHVYSKNPTLWKASRNLVERSAQQAKAYKNPDNDYRGPWKAENATAQAGHGTESQTYRLLLPSGEEVLPPSGRCWLYTKKRFDELRADGRVWFGKDNRGRPAIKRFLSEVQSGVVPTSWWSYEEAGHNQDAKREILALFDENSPFDTPKPEKLLRRIIQVSTKPGDLVLDSFLGSGTTAAVAHKMGRRWIGVELGDHCQTHCIPRLQKVINGADPGGITEAVGWKGGGGFRFFKLAPPDEENNKKTTA